MAAQLYSWTRFTFGGTKPADHIMPGAKVSRSDFKDLDDDEFENLKQVGALREQPYPIPEDENFDGSPRDYVLAKIEEMKQNELFDSVTDTWHVPHLQAKAVEAMQAKDSGIEDVSGQKIDPDSAAKK